jgi:prepilin-type N-terminal cleavage/methylation domain-containing protein
MTITLIRQRGGFSFIEVLVVLAVGTVVASAIIMLLLGQVRLTSAQNRNMINQQLLRDVLSFMTDEINSLGLETTIEPISIAAEDQFKFIGDINGDGDMDEIDYVETGGQLLRRLSSTTDGGATWNEVSEDVLIENVEAVEFTYFAPGNAETAVLSEISSVQIKVTLDTDADSNDFVDGKVRDQSMTSRVTLRNRV